MEEVYNLKIKENDFAIFELQSRMFIAKRIKGGIEIEKSCS
jgi:hypothetical protein